MNGGREMRGGQMKIMRYSILPEIVVMFIAGIFVFFLMIVSIETLNNNSNAHIARTKIRSKLLFW
jgi:Mn2+/Fe2+ NRAMP family transporter